MNALLGKLVVLHQYHQHKNGFAEIMILIRVRRRFILIALVVKHVSMEIVLVHVSLQQKPAIMLMTTAMVKLMRALMLAKHALLALALAREQGRTYARVMVQEHNAIYNQERLEQKHATA